MIRWLVVVIGLASGPAWATQDGWPALFDVTGVAATDVLNIRAAPSASAPIIGTLAPDAEGIEVIAANDRLTWGRVNTGETSGWVSLAYLARRPGQWDGALPQVDACFGTEPFWRITRSGDEIVFASAGEDALAFRTTAFSGSQNRRDSFHLFAQGASGSATLILVTEQCSDGMSDRLYGISVQALLQAGDDLRHVSGCCTLSAQ